MKKLILAEIASINMGRKNIPGYFIPLKHDTGIPIPIYMVELPNVKKNCSYTESPRKK